MPSTATRNARLKTIAALRGGASSNERHVHQFKIACLELERTRCTRERHAHMNRIKHLERRLAELDASIGKHLEVLAVPDPLREAPLHEALAPRPVTGAAGEKRRTLRY